MPRLTPVRSERLTLLVSFLLLAGFNLVLWQHLWSITPAFSLRIGFGLILFCCFNLILTLFAFKWLFKPLAIVLFLCGASAAFFMQQYGVLIDSGMFRNIAETNPAEVRDLLSWRLFAYLGLLGVLPSLVLWKLPIAWRPWPRELLVKGAAVVCSALVCVGVVMSNYQGLSSLFRNHHELHLMVVPSNLVGASASYLGERFATAREPYRQIGLDARKDTTAWAGHARKSLTVLVVGESARADHFGVLGYDRDTTPELAREPGLIGFTQAWSCGTETAVSVPCMFSNLGRQHYSARVAKNQDGLLDLLKRAGLSVVWRDNQAGCKETCNNVNFEDLSHSKDADLCTTQECHDEILLQNLQSMIDNLQGDTVLVLHQMGSHGPEYYKRYPKAFEHFTPVCQSNALNDCSRDSIVNAYDNTIRYTDHVLAQLIDVLRNNQQRVDTAMWYLSDHGESLGEYNLFLHGTPYMMAPDQQKHIAMVAWFSDNYQRSFALDTQCLSASRSQPVSQDNLFHSMLGLLSVDTQLYDRKLDMFANCRSVAADGVLAEH